MDRYVLRVDSGSLTGKFLRKYSNDGLRVFKCVGIKDATRYPSEKAALADVARTKFVLVAIRSYVDYDCIVVSLEGVDFSVVKEVVTYEDVSKSVGTGEKFEDVVLKPSTTEFFF